MEKMTRKELASELYDLYIKAGDLQPSINKDKWVKQQLNGWGFVRGATQKELEFDVACIKAELKCRKN